MKYIPYFDLFYLKLGNQCNFVCKHCSQGSVPRVDESNEISSNVIQFLDEYVKKYKHRRKSIIRFWGGEPLLYFDFIKQLIERYQDSFEYTFISNGSLLNEEIVSFINKHNIKFVLSHDGETTRLIRNIDVLENSKIKSLFEKIKHKSFMSVITALNPRIDKITDYFRNMNYQDIHIYFVWLVNHDGTEDQNKLSQIDFEEYKKGCQEAFLRYKKHQNHQEYYPREYSFITTFLLKLKSPKTRTFDEKNSYIKMCENCGYYTGNKMMELDVHGNVYECHNGNNIVGTIDEEYLKLEKKAKDLKAKKIKGLNCKECSLSNVCKGVCPNSTQLGSEIWCKFNKITLLTILEELQKENL